MEFPITRDDLLNYKDNVLFKTEIDDRVERIVKIIAKAVKHTLTTTNQRKHVFEAEHYLVYDQTRTTIHNARPNQALVMKKVLETLNKDYKDCKIVLDPLQKTITIDWSKQTQADWS